MSRDGDGSEYIPILADVPLDYGLGERDTTDEEDSGSIGPTALRATSLPQPVLFTFGCYIVDKDKLYNAPDLKRYVCANKTETYMSKSERDTFRYIGKSYQELTPEQRRAIASCKDPEFPLGVPQWVAYITSTVLEKVSIQDRLKRILTHSAFSSLADTYCRFLWGRGTFANTMLCGLIRESSPTRRSRPLRTCIVDSYGVEARSRIEKCLETCIGSSPPREDTQIATRSIKQKSIRLSRDDCLGSLLQVNWHICVSFIQQPMPPQFQAVQAGTQQHAVQPYSSPQRDNVFNAHSVQESRVQSAPVQSSTGSDGFRHPDASQSFSPRSQATIAREATTLLQQFRPPSESGQFQAVNNGLAAASQHGSQQGSQRGSRQPSAGPPQ
ncbi:DNA-binding proteins Bright/BRCAA1/RBP1 and proteins containing BRIGHT domain [Exophiala xenobiotica]|nr:DNA-binding proteins Bright/BRCAA1/RBP1 and proteins containing BRIGHT domain [Exophiala xenobiotica]